SNVNFIYIDKGTLASAEEVTSRSLRSGPRRAWRMPPRMLGLRLARTASSWPERNLHRNEPGNDQVREEEALWLRPYLHWKSAICTSATAIWKFSRVSR